MSDPTRLTAERESQIRRNLAIDMRMKLNADASHEREELLDEIDALRTELAQAQQTKIESDYAARYMEAQETWKRELTDLAAKAEHVAELEAKLAQVEQERDTALLAEKIADRERDNHIRYFGNALARQKVIEESLAQATRRAEHAEAELAALKARLTAENIGTLYVDAHVEWKRNAQYTSDVEFDEWLCNWLAQRLTMTDLIDKYFSPAPTKITDENHS